MSKNLGPMTVKAQWERYLRIIPVGASATQVMETRRAFYAASHVMLLMMRDGLAALPEDEGVKVLEKLHQECVEFAYAIGRGEA